MEREAMEDRGRHDRDGGVRSTDSDLGLDDEEFSSIEDVGTEPSENPAVDDV